MLKLSNTALVSVLSLVMWNVGRSHAYPVGGSANCKDAIAKDGPSNAGKLSRTCFSSFACVTVENSVCRPPPAAAGAAGGRAPFGASRPEPGCARPERPWLAAAIPAAEPGKNCNMVLGPKFVLS